MARWTISRDRRGAILGGGGDDESRWTRVFRTADSRRWDKYFLSFLESNRRRSVERDLGLGYGYGGGCGDLWCRNHALAIGSAMRLVSLRFAAFRLLDFHWASRWATCDRTGDERPGLEQTGEQSYQDRCASFSHSLP